MLICFFCDKINNIYALIFFVAFFIKDIGNISEDITGGQMRVFVISAVAAGVALVSFAVKTFIVKKGIIEKGKLFYPLLIADAAFLLGGCIGRLNFMQIGLVFGFEFSVMLLYLLALNCTEDLGKFLAKTFIIGALFVSAEIIYVKWADGNIFDGNVINQKVFFFSAHSLNTGAIFLMLGIVGCYMLGAKRKSDVLYFLLALYFVFALFLSCCRTMLAISCLVVAAIYVLLIVFSPKKLNFLWLTVLLVAVAAIGCVLFKEKIAKFRKTRQRTQRQGEPVAVVCGKIPFLSRVRLRVYRFGSPAHGAYESRACAQHVAAMVHFARRYRRVNDEFFLYRKIQNAVKGL